MQQTSYKIFYPFYFLLIIASVGCNIGPGFSEIPEIEFIGLSSDTLEQGSLFQDSIFISIRFKDGDGDLGSGTSNITQNIRFIDSRTEDESTAFKIPNLDINAAMTGIEGEIIMKFYSTCCLFPPEEELIPCSIDSRFPMDELSLSIQMTDDGGNASNVISTPPITLLCN